MKTLSDKDSSDAILDRANALLDALDQSSFGEPRRQKLRELRELIIGLEARNRTLRERFRIEAISLNLGPTDLVAVRAREATKRDMTRLEIRLRRLFPEWRGLVVRLQPGESISSEPAPSPTPSPEGSAARKKRAALVAATEMRPTELAQTSQEKHFLVTAREHAKHGVGYGWMQQAIESLWRWETCTAAHGPATFDLERFDLERKIQSLESALAAREALIRLEPLKAHNRELESQVEIRDKALCQKEDLIRAQAESSRLAAERADRAEEFIKHQRAQLEDLETRAGHLRARIAELEAENMRLIAPPAPLVQHEYRYEAHGTTFEGRRLMERLGKDGWLFIGFVPHWGPSDGRTMLFSRPERPVPIPSDGSEPIPF